MPRFLPPCTARTSPVSKLDKRRCLAPLQLGAHVCACLASPELRRKGIVASSSGTFSIEGRRSQMSKTEVAELLRLKVRAIGVHCMRLLWRLPA